MNRQSITQAIMDRVESAKAADYSLWTIGLTHFPNERKKQREWIADSFSDALGIRSFFISQKEGTTKELSTHKAVYVYVF